MLTIDGHCDLLSSLLEKGLESFDDNNEQISRERWHLGGPDLLVTAIYVSQKYLPQQKEAKALQMAGIFWKLVANKEFVPVLFREDLASKGKKALLAIEGGEPISTKEDLFAFYRLGVRMLSLTWNYQNHLATGCLESYPGGLTQKAKEIIPTAEKLGMILDVSHLSQESFWQLLEITTNPIVASHSNAAGLYQHPRNLTDQQLGAIAKRGGVIGVNFCPEFLSEKTQKTVLKQIIYITKTIGSSHVGIGSDFLGISESVDDLEHLGKWLSLDKELKNAGFNERERENILGGNFQRVFDQVLKSTV